MGVVTTRRVDQLRVECEAAGIAWTPEDGRLELMDKLRASLGSFDSTMEIDPMKAKDLKSLIAWGSADPFKGIEAYLTDAYVAEPKLDGARLRMFLGLTGNTLNTGRRSVRTFAYIDRTANFPHLAQAVLKEWAGVVLDGELMAPTGRIQTHTGLWTNSMLNASVALVNAKPAGSVATQKRFGTAKFFVFDILFTAGGESVQHLPYAQRRVLLETVVADIQAAHPDCGIHLVPSLPATVDTIKSSLDLGFEGVVIKSKAGTYKPGKRGPEWLKVKVMSTADAFVVGYAPGENGNDGFVGSLEVAVLTHEAGNPEHVKPFTTDGDGRQVYTRAVGQVGNLTDEYRKAITASDGSLKQEVYGTVVEVMAQGLGKNGRMRHAHLVRLRPDKAAFDCWDDQLEVFVSV